MNRQLLNATLCAIVLAITGCTTSSGGPAQWPSSIKSLTPAPSISPVSAQLLPDTVIVSDPNQSEQRQPWTGIWRGWACKDRRCDIKLAIEGVTETGATLVYSAASSGLKPFAERVQGTFFESELRAPLSTGSVLHTRLRENGDMEMAVFKPNGSLLAAGALTKKPFNFVRRSYQIPTDWRESGKRVTLEAVTYLPIGSQDKALPTLVVNHGPTNPQEISESWHSLALANFFTERGWQVVFPQRRGRGQSGGVYDEGYNSSRSDYSCNPAVSLAGVDRALDDIDATMQFLRTQPSVDASRMLISGVSRGGILSIAYAGLNPDSVNGVINFVGGWMGEDCGNVSRINPVIFERGAAFKKPTLWLYGENDPFYSVSHSRENFYRFEALGGQGKFLTFTPLNGTSGHFIHDTPQLWADEVDNYLGRAKAAQ